MTPVERQILTNQSVIMNALAGMYALRDIDSKTSKKELKDKIKETTDQTIILLTKSTMITQGMLNKATGITNGTKPKLKEESKS